MGGGFLEDCLRELKAEFRNKAVSDMSDGSLALDCVICTSKPLSLPVFQCTNGHTLCSACCLEVKDKTLNDLLCSCPLSTCKFVGSNDELVTHCRNHYWTHLKFDTCISVYIYRFEEYKLFQEPKEGTVFIVRNKNVPIGNAFSISCIGPSSLKEGFRYDMIAQGSSRGSSLRLQSTVDIVQGLPMDEPEELIKSLIVPNKWLSEKSNDLIKLDFWIWKRCKQPELIARS